MAVMDPAANPGAYYFAGGPVPMRGAVGPPGLVILPYPPPPPMAVMPGPVGQPYPPGPPQGARPRPGGPGTPPTGSPDA